MWVGSKSAVMEDSSDGDVSSQRPWPSPRQSSSDPGDVESEREAVPQAVPKVMKKPAAKKTAVRRAQQAAPKMCIRKPPAVEMVGCEPILRTSQLITADQESDSGSVVSEREPTLDGSGPQNVNIKPAPGGSKRAACKLKIASGPAKPGRNRLMRRPMVVLDFQSLAAEPEPKLSEQVFDRARTIGQCILGATMGMLLVVEIFAGCCRFSGATAEAGLNICVPIDKDLGDWANVDNPVVQAVLLLLLQSGRVWYVHLATPCTPWSRARTTGKGAANMNVIWFTTKVLRSVVENNLSFSMENPYGSGLFSFPPIAELLVELKAFTVRYDCCAWGATFQKPSEMRSNWAPLKELGRRCREPFPSIMKSYAALGVA